MSNYSNTLGLTHFVIDIWDNVSISSGLVSIFNCDNDFIENEEYFRTDTIAKGYKNEADRIVSEYMKKHDISNMVELEKAVDYIAEKIYSNTTYYSSYTSNISKVTDNLFSIAISFIS